MSTDRSTSKQMHRLRYGQRIAVEGVAFETPVANENDVQVAAGLTMAIGAVAFSYAYFDHIYIPLRAVTTFFLVEFLIRVTVGIQYSPVGIIAHRINGRKRAPRWVAAAPKRFAWSLGLAMALTMTIITNTGIRNYPLWVPRTMCLTCLTLIWLEAVLGLCLGCKMHALLVRRGWTRYEPSVDLCADGTCELPIQAMIERTEASHG